MGSFAKKNKGSTIRRGSNSSEERKKEVIFSSQDDMISSDSPFHSTKKMNARNTNMIF